MHNVGVLTLSAVVLIALGGSGGGLGPFRVSPTSMLVDATSPMIFELPQQPMTQDLPLYITFKHTHFNESVLVYLSDNVTKCATAATYASPFWPTNAPSGSSVLGRIQQWTRHDPAQDWRARFTLTSPQSVSEVYVCYSLNKGANYLHAENSMGRTFFKLWQGMPTATTEPHTVVVGRPLYLHLRNIPSFSKLALVTSEVQCRAGHHMTVNATQTLPHVYTFALHPEATGYFFVCLSGPNYDHWNIVPVDQGSQLTHNIGAGGSGPTHHTLLDGVGFWIYPDTVGSQLASVGCTTVISGAECLCTINLNKTVAATAVAADLSIELLTDGAGKADCPLPPIRPTNLAGEFNFRWTPQHHGREGMLKLRFQGNPLLVHPNELSAPYFTFIEGNTSFPNTAPSNPYPSSTRDLSVMHFFVEPEYSFSQSFDYMNYLNINYLEPKNDRVWADGVPTVFGGRQNGTRDSEMRTVTLKRAGAINSGTFTQIVNLPAGARDCQVSIHYYFTGSVIDEFNSVQIGRFKVTPQDSTGADLPSLTDYTIWSSLKRTIIMGGHKRAILDGDVSTWEQLIRHFGVLTTYSKIKLELEIDHSVAKELYFANSRLKCVTTDPYTHPEDFRMLKELYASLSGATSLLTNWETAPASGVWNGDPCKEQWQGVVCRHFRVVRVNLANRKLVGTLPAGLSRMSRLEQLDLHNNSISGAVPSDFKNMTRLVSVDLSSNILSSIQSDHVFAHPFQSCLTSIQLQHNELSHFPRQVLDLPKLTLLDIHQNLLVDNLPDMDLLESKLESLNVRDNRMVGTLPKLNALTLKSADFSANRFNGTVPMQWGDLQEARFLDVSGNLLEGKIPSELGKIRTAASMVFNSVGNFHSGFMPNLPFSRVDIRGNMFRCPLPYEYDWIVNPIVGLEDNHIECNWYDPDYANEE